MTDPDTQSTFGDPDRTICLCDVGSPDYLVDVAVAADGSEHLLLAHRDSIGDPSVRYDPACSAVAHEQLGALPLDYVRRMTVAARRRRTHRCGRPTQAGKPCRMRVPAPGSACEWHRPKVDQ